MLCCCSVGNASYNKNLDLGSFIIITLPTNVCIVTTMVFPREGNGNLLHYSCPENPMDKGAWWAAVHRVAQESDITEVT